MPMSRETFPCCIPVDKPPPLQGDLINGRPAPTYVLTWVCSPRTFFKNLGGGELGKVDDCNFTDVVSEKWEARPGFGLAFAPIPFPGADGNFYLIAMFNRPHADHFTRVRNVAGDPLIQAARVSMGVDQDKSLEGTLQWYRWPLHWLHAEERQRQRAGLTQLQSELEDSAPTSPPQVSVD
ncbi:hypothetical protein B0H10DRAFT_1923033 [Mycena sp. CBHHK59/15]|nr:hypothetical protein B0H10DRAFT_1923033 [Mycena sp. CBHHK59/15]